jgi:hypothetical protein
MASRKQIAANRRNAKQSTGPRTAEGKARSAQNATKHGLTSRQVVLADEDAAQFEELRRNLQEDLAPESQLETLLVNRIAAQQWRLARVPAIEAELLEALRGDPASGPRGLAEAFRQDAGPCGGALTRLARYEAMLERSLARLLEALWRAQAERRRREAERVSPPPRQPGARPADDDYWPAGAPAPTALAASLAGWPGGADDGPHAAKAQPDNPRNEADRRGGAGVAGYLTTASRFARSDG